MKFESRNTARFLGYVSLESKKSPEAPGDFLCLYFSLPVGCSNAVSSDRVAITAALK